MNTKDNVVEKHRAIEQARRHMGLYLDVQRLTEEADKKAEKPMDVKQVLSERTANYGNFASLAEISQGLKQVMRNTRNWDKLSADKKEALEMNVHKIARILNGDSEYKDNFVDIAGYATLVANTLKDIK